MGENNQVYNMTAKGTEIFSLFSDYWQLMKKYVPIKVMDRSEDYWDDFLQSVDRFYQKHSGEFSKSLLGDLAVMLDRQPEEEVSDDSPLKQMMVAYWNILRKYVGHTNISAKNEILSSFSISQKKFVSLYSSCFARDLMISLQQELIRQMSV